MISITPTSSTLAIPNMSSKLSWPIFKQSLVVVVVFDLWVGSCLQKAWAKSFCVERMFCWCSAWRKVFFWAATQLHINEILQQVRWQSCHPVALFLVLLLMGTVYISTHHSVNGKFGALCHQQKKVRLLRCFWTNQPSSCDQPGLFHAQFAATGYESTTVTSKDGWWFLGYQCCSCKLRGFWALPSKGVWLKA